MRPQRHQGFPGGEPLHGGSRSAVRTVRVAAGDLFRGTHRLWPKHRRCGPGHRHRAQRDPDALGRGEQHPFRSGCHHQPHHDPVLCDPDGLRSAEGVLCQPQAGRHFAYSDCRGLSVYVQHPQGLSGWLRWLDEAGHRSVPDCFFAVHHPHRWTHDLQGPCADGGRTHALCR